MRRSNPSSVNDLFESCAILIESCNNSKLLTMMDLLFGDLANETYAAAYCLRFDHAVYDIYHLDVWGNEEDGFEVNNQFLVGQTFFPNDEQLDIRMNELIGEEGIQNIQGIHWTNDQSGLIEIIDATGRPHVTLMERNIADDVSRVIEKTGLRHITVNYGSMIPGGEPEQFIQSFQELKELILQAYSNDESGHELVRLRVWINRLSRGAAYKGLAVNGYTMKPKSTQKEIDDWMRWMEASLSPEEVDGVISDWIQSFEVTCDQLNNGHPITNGSVDPEALIMGVVRQAGG